MSDVHSGARDALLARAEAVLEEWVRARGEIPTSAQREGFRLLALHRQGAHALPSFNACRETCREIAYHYNLLSATDSDGRAGHHARMMAALVEHLALFVRGKLEVAALGDFCCSSRSAKLQSTAD